MAGGGAGRPCLNQMAKQHEAWAAVSSVLCECCRIVHFFLWPQNGSIQHIRIWKEFFCWSNLVKWNSKVPFLKK